MGAPWKLVAAMARPLSATAWEAVWQKPFAQWGPSEWAPLAGACLQPSLRVAEATAPLTLDGRSYQVTTVRLLTPLPVWGGRRMAGGVGGRRTAGRTAPRTRATAPEGAGEDARARRRARRARERAAAEARAAADAALRPRSTGERRSWRRPWGPRGRRSGAWRAP